MEKRDGQAEENSKKNSSGRKDEKESPADAMSEKPVAATASESVVGGHKLSIHSEMSSVDFSGRVWDAGEELSEEYGAAISQSAGNYQFHSRNLQKPTETSFSVKNFQRRMSRVHPLGVESSDSNMSIIKEKLSKRMNVQVLTEKLKKRVKGEKSVRNFLDGKWKYLECLPFIRWPKAISRNTLFHDYIFYAFAFALFISDGYLLSCLLHGFGYEYNLYAMNVLTATAAAKKTHPALKTATSLYSISGILVILIFVSIFSAIIGTMGYYTANRKYHYWYVSLIGASILAQCGIAIDVSVFKGHFCKEVKGYMDAKLIHLVGNYYATSPVIRTPVIQENRSYTPKFKIKDSSGKEFRVRNFIDASLMDVLQTYYFCCGHAGYKDYLNASFFRYPISDPRHLDWKPKIPRSCCTMKWNRNIACSSQVPKNSQELKAKLFQEGCSSKMDSVCKNVFFYLGRGMFIFSAWQSLFFLISLMCIIIQIRQIKRLERSSRFKVDPKIMDRPLETMQCDNVYDKAEIQQHTLDKSPNANSLPKWYRDFLESYRTHRRQYIFNRTHAAKYGFEPHPAISLQHLRQQKLSLPLERDIRGDTMPIATSIRPTFTKRFHEEHRDIRNKVVLSRYDRDINEWVTDIGLDRKERYNPDELAIVQYNESDWEENAKRKLLIESDVLAKYHDLGKSHAKAKPVQPKHKKNDKHQPGFVPYKRKPGSPQPRPNWYSPKDATSSSMVEKAEESTVSTLSELAKDPGSIFHKPNEEMLKREKEQNIAWRIGRDDSLEYIPKKKAVKIRKKLSASTIQQNRFLAQERRALSPPKPQPSVVDPIRVGYLEYKTERPLKPPPLHLPPSEVSTIPASSLSQSTLSSVRSDSIQSVQTNTTGYQKYYGEDLYKASTKRKREKDVTFIVNPKSKVPFDPTYYRQEIPSDADRKRNRLETTQTTHIGAVPEDSEHPKSYVNRRAKKWEEQAKKFKW